MATSPITIGIPTYNGADRLDNLLASLALRTDFAKTTATIAVVDDGSPDKAPVLDTVRKWEKRLPIIYTRHATNRGIAAGWNTVLDSAEAEYAVLVNDDVIVSRDWLEPLIFILRRSPLVGVVGQSWHAFTKDDVPKLLASERSDEEVVPREPVSKAPNHERRRLYEDTNPGRVMCPTGQLFAFRLADYDAIGRFDETYKSFYEESDFGTAMAKSGKIGVQLTWPFCWHMWSATFGSSPELRASERLAASHEHYCRKWQVPAAMHKDPFGYTNPTYLGAIGDVEIAFKRRDMIERGILRQDGSYASVAQESRKDLGLLP